ncbi:uncharacterized protein LOC113095791 isoform X1 [Carassius auratus]|uniref:Uncharacterized protein LOC113095791 isoform X1 n=1 Tax=Carassius auratus TaxID=7957 RepID=A0A6P6P8M3_CARAU|nr:uncharacterized protein LOC113095791 isoform X1 [Carassius auratus]
MALGFVVFCGTIVSLVLPVTANGDYFDGHFAAYSPGFIYDVWHIPQPHNFDGFEPMFPMPYDTQPLSRKGKHFSLRIMNSSWSGPADTNVFHKGEQLYLQVSASPAPGQQLYVQSCHASSSPNHADKPDVALIINKGCVASKESLVKFVLQQRDRVNLMVCTSSLKSSESYIHCRVYLTDLGLTSTTKFCNYNKLKSRWVDLGGQTSVCDCCGRRCKSSKEHAELPVSLDLTAVVSTGPLIIEDKLSAPQATPLAPSDYSTKSSSTAGARPDKNWIVASDSFSKGSMQNVGNVSPWPVQRGFGGDVMVVSQGLGGELSMWLPEILELVLNPVVQMAIGYPGDPTDLTFLDEPFRKLKPDETSEKSPVVALEGQASVEAVKSHDVVKDGYMWQLDDADRLYKIQEKPDVTEADHLEQLKLSLESDFDFAPNDQPLISPTPDKLSESAEDEGEVVYRQSEMVFKSAKGAKPSEPIIYSKLSLNRAVNGSTFLNYEEQKRPSMNKPDHEQNAEKSQKDEPMEGTSKIKDLVSSLLDQLRRLWTVQ